MNSRYLNSGFIKKVVLDLLQSPFSKKNKFSVKNIFIFFYSFLFLLLSALFIIGVTQNIEVGFLTRDPATVLDYSPFIGFLSNIGIILWVFGVAICFFAAALLKQANRNSKALFLFSSGIITLLLMLDDLFMIHDYVFPVFFKVNEKFIYAFYVIMILTYLYYFRKRILKTVYPVLLLSLIFLGGSLLSDTVFHRKDIEVVNNAFSGPQPEVTMSAAIHLEDVYYLFEDGLKIFGIATWLIYFFLVSSSWISIKHKKVKQSH